MNERPDEGTLRAAVGLAGLAPSLFNVQPWRFELEAGALLLHVDRSRSLPVTDPHDRELTLSCGAALQHAVLAMHVLGWRVRVRRLPGAHVPDLLATVEVLGPQEASEAEIALAQAACSRHTDRAQYAPESVAGALLGELLQAGRHAGAEVAVLDGDRRYALARAFAKAAAVHGASQAYRDELAAWTGRASAHGEGMPQATAPQHGVQYGDLVIRDFGRVSAAHEEIGTARTVGSLLLISTATDDRLDQLRAGEAAGALLCTAEREGLAASPLSEAFEVERTRRDVAREVLGDAGYPQLAVRVGWPASGRRPPASPRRSVEDLLRGLGDDIRR